MLLCLATGSQCEREPGDDRSRIRRQHAAQEQPGADDHASGRDPAPAAPVDQPAAGRHEKGCSRAVTPSRSSHVGGVYPMPIHEPDVLDLG